jgi:hypothetical protein
MSLIQCASYLRKGIPMAKISYSRRVETIRCFTGLLERPIPAGFITPALRGRHRLQRNGQRLAAFERLPVWVKSCPHDPKMRLPLFPQQRTSRIRAATSEKCQQQAPPDCLWTCHLVRHPGERPDGRVPNRRPSVLDAAVRREFNANDHEASGPAI